MTNTRVCSTPPRVRGRGGPEPRRERCVIARARSGSLHSSSSIPAKRWPRASSRSSAASVLAWPSSSSLTQVRSTLANSSASPCARSMPLGPDAPISAAVSIHCCERTASPLSASARPGLQDAERISERTASLCGSRISSRRISTSNSRSRGDSSAMSASIPASTARSISLIWAARIASVEANSARNSASDSFASEAICDRPICSNLCSASSDIKLAIALSRLDLLPALASAARALERRLDLRAMANLLNARYP